MNIINEDINIILNNLKILFNKKENRGSEEDLKDQI